MTSEEDQPKRLSRLWAKLTGKNGDSRSGGTPPHIREDNNPLDNFKDDPKKNRRK